MMAPWSTIAQIRKQIVCRRVSFIWWCKVEVSDFYSKIRGPFIIYKGLKCLMLLFSIVLLILLLTLLILSYPSSTTFKVI